MSYDEIRYALDDRLKTWADAEPIEVEWDNTNRPAVADDEQFLTTSFSPARPGFGSVGVTGKNRRVGIYGVNVRGHLGEGAGPLIRLADEIVGQFNRVVLTQGTTRVTASRAWTGPAFADGDYYVVPVSVQWFSYP